MILQHLIYIVLRAVSSITSICFICFQGLASGTPELWKYQILSTVLLQRSVVSFFLSSVTQSQVLCFFSSDFDRNYSTFYLCLTQDVKRKGTDSPLLQWIGDTAVPCTPDLPKPRARKKSSRCVINFFPDTH